MLTVLISSAANTDEIVRTNKVDIKVLNSLIVLSYRRFFDHFHLAEINCQLGRIYTTDKGCCAVNQLLVILLIRLIVKLNSTAPNRPTNKPSAATPA